MQEKMVFVTAFGTVDADVLPADLVASVKDAKTTKRGFVDRRTRAFLDYQKCEKLAHQIALNAWESRNG